MAAADNGHEGMELEDNFLNPGESVGPYDESVFADYSSSEEEETIEADSAQSEGGGAAAVDGTAGSSLMDPSGTVADVPGYPQACCGPT